MMASYSSKFGLKLNKVNMLKNQIIISLAIIFWLVSNPFHAQAESRTDSTGIESKDGVVYIIHKVEANETWYALSRRYKVKVEDLMAANDNKALKADEIIIIPTELNAGDIDMEVGDNFEREEELPPVKKTPVFYKVKHGETLYSISKKFNKSIFALKEWNTLASDDLKEGNEIIVNYILDYKEPVKLAAINTTPLENSTDDSEVILKIDIGEKQVQKASKTEAAPGILKNVQEGEKKKKKKKKNNKSKPHPPAIPVKLSKDELKKLEATQSISEIKTENADKVIKKYVETGIGAYVSDVNLNQNRYYALHRTAPKGTIIKVTNTMNGQYVYVKVVGSLPDTGDNNNQVIKVSEAAAKKMGVLDTYFRATLTYGVADK